MERVKRRNPVVAFVLSVIFPGLGQMYNGQLGRGTGLLAALLLASVVGEIIGLKTTFLGLCILIVLGSAIYLSVAVDALLGARRVKEMSLRWYNRWYYYAGIYGLFLLAFIHLAPLARPLYTLKANMFIMPAASMEPTLCKGDRFMTRVNPYLNGTPVRNDVVVFPYPEDPSKKFVKRIVGLEGDKVQIKDKQLLVNDRPVDEPWVVHQDPLSWPKEKSPRDYFGPMTVPQGAVFVLGDNRDHSLDSRFFGFVKWQEVVGKALYIYWSSDRNRIGHDVK